ncbi:GNAT family N-acetyltransferase [Pseudoduganella sp. FT55W]|uniref:GNAT family N-acetyltransferase n=1 Tax=Duganella rivi TaxID=2666083 RepID=A0A7X4KEB6_9BURK|nr:GNAT family N-acetyltransferase [Duganella rivi]MYM70239.1 GNAT family N-acetyltransferase [Duganella rivi]
MKIILNQKSVLASPKLMESFFQLAQDDIEFLRGSYPNFDKWLSTKVFPGIMSGERTLVLEQRGSHSVGLLIVKHTANEKKLCTLRVRPEFEYSGMGVRLFNSAFEILETSHPLLSVSETALPKFSRIFEYFGFSCEKAYRNLYLPGVQELSYNGILNSEEIQGKERERCQQSFASKRDDLLILV